MFSPLHRITLQGFTDKSLIHIFFHLISIWGKKPEDKFSRAPKAEEKTFHTCDVN